MNRRPYSSMVSNLKPEQPEAEDYVFRFPLRSASCSDTLSLKEMLGTHLRELLDILVPTSGDQEVQVRGFKLMNDPSSVHHLYPSEERGILESNDPLEIYEPRIKYIQRILESLLAVVDLEVEGEKVAVDGFRLKKPGQWLRPSGGAADILAHAATRCNLKCRFCYNAGSPPALKSRPRSPDEEHKEIRARISHYTPGSRLSLFPNTGSPCEALTHPRFDGILAALRQKTLECIRIPTNGSLLTTAMIERLGDHQPIFLDVSLNSASPSRRRWLMNDRNPQVAIESLAGLREAEIPYSVVVVPWPFPSREVMLEDLRQTVAFAAANDPAFIQISLPGYSRFLSEKLLFPQDQVWDELKSAVQGLRPAIDCPLILRPGLFEEYLEPEAVNTPRLIGLIKNSPAARAGLLRGDRLLKVGGLPVHTRTQARSLLTTLHASHMTRSSLTVLRDGEQLDLGLDLTDFDYPYAQQSAAHLGIVFPSAGLPMEWLERLRLAISSRPARKVLVLTSRLVKPALEKRIKDSPLFSGVSLCLHVPPNRYLGGNIFMGDLMVVEDFIDGVRDFLGEEKVLPDLVVIPSSPFHLSGWGRDLRGYVYKEVERRLGIPVALVECDPIFD